MQSHEHEMYILQVVHEAEDCLAHAQKKAICAARYWALLLLVQGLMLSCSRAQLGSSAPCGLELVKLSLGQA